MQALYRCKGPARVTPSSPPVRTITPTSSKLSLHLPYIVLQSVRSMVVSGILPLVLVPQVSPASPCADHRGFLRDIIIVISLIIPSRLNQQVLASMIDLAGGQRVLLSLS